MARNKKLDKSLFYTPREKMGMPWTYTEGTKAKLEEDQKGTVTPPTARLAPEYDTTPTKGGMSLPKRNNLRPVSNGRRSQCLGYKSDFKTGEQRILPEEFQPIEVGKKKFIKRVRFTKRNKLVKQRFNKVLP